MARNLHAGIPAGANVADLTGDDLTSKPSDWMAPALDVTGYLLGIPKASEVVDYSKDVMLAAMGQQTVQDAVATGEAAAAAAAQELAAEQAPAAEMAAAQAHAQQSDWYNDISY